MSPTSLRNLGAVLTIVAFVGSGCGSHKPSVGQIAKSGDCVALAQHVAATNAVRSRIAHGTISRAELASAFKGIPHAAYLDTSGRLLPFGKLSYDAKLALVDWVAKLETNGPGGGRIYNAEMQAAKAAQARCVSS